MIVTDRMVRYIPNQYVSVPVLEVVSLNEIDAGVVRGGCLLSCSDFKNTSLTRKYWKGISHSGECHIYLPVAIKKALPSGVVVSLEGESRVQFG